MNLLFYHFKRSLEHFRCFSLVDIKKHFPNFDSKRLVEWQAKGYIQKIRNGYYIWDDFEDEFTNWLAVSHKCYKPSYISLQTALSVYGFIPEGVFSIMAISSAKTYAFQYRAMTFSYRNIQTGLFWGYTIVKAPNGLPFCLATPEKAMLDFLYFNQSAKGPKDFDAMRFNKTMIKEKLKKKRFKECAALFGGKQFQFRCQEFLNWVYA